MGFEKVNLNGRLGRDPELRKTKNDKSVCNLSVLFDDPAGGEQPLSRKVVVWGKLAEACNKHLSKGKEVTCFGYYRPSNYENKDGIQVRSLEMSSNEVRFH